MTMEDHIHLGLDEDGDPVAAFETIEEAREAAETGDGVLCEVEDYWPDIPVHSSEGDESEEDESESLAERAGADFSYCKDIHQEINTAMRGGFGDRASIRHKNALMVKDAPGIWQLYYSEEGEPHVWLTQVNLTTFKSTGEVGRFLEQANHVEFPEGDEDGVEDEDDIHTGLGRGFQ